MEEYYVDNKEYGFSKQERVFTISEKIEKTRETYALEYEGKIIYLPVITVQIGLLIYRIENFRTITAQKEYCSTKKLPDSFFKVDKETIDTQMAQNEILLKMVDDADLLSTFSKEREKGQTEPLIVTDEGVVVNGNRRLCAWRYLLKSDEDKYRSFKTIKIAVLPNHDHDSIIDLEQQLQIKHDIKADYKWHAQALSYISEIERKKIKPEDLDKKLNFKNGVVEEAIQAYRMAEEFLIYNDVKDQWSLVDGAQYAFKQIVQNINKVTTEDDFLKGDVFKSISFAVIKASTENKLAKGTGRIYDKIPDIAKYTDEIITKFKVDTLKEEFDEIRSECDDDIDSTTIINKLIKKSDPSLIANTAIRETETLNEIENEIKSKSALIGFIQKASDNIGKAVTADKSDQFVIGLDKLLTSIEQNITKLRQWLKEYENNN